MSKKMEVSDMPRTQPKNRRPARSHAEWHTYPIEWKQLENEENMLVGYASVWGFPADEHGDVVRQGAFRKTIRERVKAGKVPLLDSHIYDSAHTLGTIVRAEEDERGLKIWAKLASSNDVVAIKRKLVEGHLSKLSIGFDVVKESFGRDPETKTPVRFLDEVKLFEISVVPIPALDRAQILSVKSVVPYQDLPLASRERPWDSGQSLSRVRSWAGGGTDLADMNWSRYRRAFLWYDSEAPEQVGSYKLPIADFVDGRLVAVPRGIFAAAAALQGARGGVDIPEADVTRIRNQVARYYAKMRDEFDDDTLVVPWETNQKGKGVTDVSVKQMLQVTNLEDMELEDMFEAIRGMWVTFDDPTNREHFEMMGMPVVMEMQDRGMDLPGEDEFFLNVMDRIAEMEMGEDNPLPMVLEESAGRLNISISTEKEKGQKAGSRHNSNDRKRIRDAVSALMELLDEADIAELMGDDKGNNKPNNVQPYNRDPDYVAPTGQNAFEPSRGDSHTHSTAERKHRQRLQALRMKELKFHSN
jgi:HK97 family phage prohead protease